MGLNITLPLLVGILTFVLASHPANPDCASAAEPPSTIAQLERTIAGLQRQIKTLSAQNAKLTKNQDELTQKLEAVLSEVDKLKMTLNDSSQKQLEARLDAVEKQLSSNRVTRGSAGPGDPQGAIGRNARGPQPRTKEFLSAAVAAGYKRALTSGSLSDEMKIRLLSV
jgi:septal ring factor EnvC (AmiA/AmiB activator)